MKCKIFLRLIIFIACWSILGLCSGCGRLWGAITYYQNGQIAGYAGVMLVQAYGDAPNAPPGTPSSRVVNITWLEFTTGSPSYALLRVSKNGLYDTSKPQNCTSGQATECLVCTASFGSATHTCTDNTVGVSPTQYDYLVTILYDNNSVLIPGSAQPFRVTVAIPPTNMVLIQQDSANYEMCEFLGQTSDPLNHQRCPYSGLGATPYNTNPGNSPLNLPSGYYDFGYNLFIDRWNAGCLWTSAVSGGMCATGPAAGDCYGQAAPTNSTQGIDGNVYYNTNTGVCSVNSAGTWQTISSGALTATQLASAYTTDPGAGSGKNPPLVGSSQTSSYSVCQASVDPNYGPKRLLRRREHISAAAWPYFVGEPGALTDAQISQLEQGSGAHSCNSANGAGTTLGAFTTTDLAGDSAGGSILSYVLGSPETSFCVSRFGAQDLIGNVNEWASDQLKNCSTVSHSCFGTTSSLDGGNIDMALFNFDGLTGPGSTTGGQTVYPFTGQWNIQTPTWGASNFSAPLGLPMVTTDSGNTLNIVSITSKFHSDIIVVDTDIGNPTRGVVNSGYWAAGSGNGRWTSNWLYQRAAANNQIGFRCALPSQ